jgi:hypothetical protein
VSAERHKHKSGKNNKIERRTRKKITKQNISAFINEPSIRKEKIKWQLK